MDHEHDPKKARGVKKRAANDNTDPPPSTLTALRAELIAQQRAADHFDPFAAMLVDSLTTADYDSVRHVPGEPEAVQIQAQAPLADGE